AASGLANLLFASLAINSARSRWSCTSINLSACATPGGLERGAGDLQPLVFCCATVGLTFPPASGASVWGERPPFTISRTILSGIALVISRIADDGIDARSRSQFGFGGGPGLNGSGGLAARSNSSTR